MNKESYKQDKTIEMTFVELLKQGKIDYKDIDDYIVEWHKGNSNKTIYEFLGMTKEQYFKFGSGNYQALKLMFKKGNK